jgi:thiamine-phosphate pyrophosphorylase
MGLAVYLVADPGQTQRDLVDDVDAALCGGVTAVQLRAKHLNDRELFGLAMRIRGLTANREALFFVNDRLDIALATGADGVHLGVDDLPLISARTTAPPDFFIGYSPETDEQAAIAHANGADYLGVGPIFGTTSKADAGDAIGLEALARRVNFAGIPVIGIGGIEVSNSASVIEAGAVGVAVVSAILRTPDPEIAAKQLAELVHAALNRALHPA